jgi:hypothetical protein
LCVISELSLWFIFLGLGAYLTSMFAGQAAPSSAPNLRQVPYSALMISVADPDPGSGAFLTPGSGSVIRNRFVPDPGS